MNARDVRVIVFEELANRRLSFEQLPEAIAAASELLHHPRASWALPRNRWEELVVGLAVATLRTQGAGLGLRRAAALALVHDAARAIAAGWTKRGAVEDAA